MSHEIETMMYMGETPWHGLGNRLEMAHTSEQAIAAAGLDWTVELRPLRLVDGPVTSYHCPAHGTPWCTDAPCVAWLQEVRANAEKIPARATVRSKDGSVLGIVGSGYKPLQNREAFAFFDDFTKAGEAVYHTAGSLRGGARVWILAKLNRESMPIVGDDVVEKFILLSNAHDGTMAVRVGFTPIRVVCANTLALAHTSGGSELIRVRHTGNVAEDVSALREAMNLANQAFEATAEQYRSLARREISTADLHAYVRLVFDRRRVGDFEGPAQEETPTDEGGAKRLLPRIVEFFETGKGNDLPKVRGTLWAAYNAITEYLSYGRGKAADARLNSLWFGEGANINRKALGVALRMAADMADAELDEVPAHPPAKQPDRGEAELTDDGFDAEERDNDPDA